MKPGLMRVEIVYPLVDSVWRQMITLPEASVVQDALVRSELLQVFPDLSLDSLLVGIFGQACALDRPLQDADRIEIYRPLIFDPMVSRRRRALHKIQKKDRPVNRPRRKAATNAP